MFVVPEISRYRTNVSNPRRANGAKRDRVRAKVLREEHHCHLCGLPVDKALPHGQPASPEVDELIPVTYGGSPYDRANCRLAHRWCNRYRWHGPVEPARQHLHANPPPFAIAAATPAPVSSRQW